MRVSPTFLIRILIPTEHEQRHIRSFRDLHGFGNQLLVFRRIAEVRSVGEPHATFFGYLAPFCISNFNPVANFVFYSLEHTHATPRIITVTAEMNLRRVWTNHSNRLQRRDSQTSRAETSRAGFAPPHDRLQPPKPGLLSLTG